MPSEPPSPDQAQPEQQAQPPEVQVEHQAQSPYHAQPGQQAQSSYHAQPGQQGQAPYYSPPGQLRPQPPNTAKPAGRRILIAAIAIGILLFAGYGMFAGFERDITAADRERLITAADVAEIYPDIETDLQKSGDQAKVRFTRTTYLDTSTELQYELDTASYYLLSQVSYELSERSARDAYTGLTVGAKAGVMLEDGTSEEELTSLSKWGSRSRWSTLLVNGNPSGHTFVGQRGKWTVLFVVGGIHFTDEKDLEAFLVPHLDSMTQGSL